jgi:hypothetical protein
MEPTTPGSLSSAPRLAARPATIALGLTAALLVVAALALWAHSGTALFYEMIVAGIAACF